MELKEGVLLYWACYYTENRVRKVCFNRISERQRDGVLQGLIVYQSDDTIQGEKECAISSMHAHYKHTVQTGLGKAKQQS